MSNFKDLIDKFLFFEENESLLDTQYNNIYFWRLIRVSLYAKLSNQFTGQNSLFPTDNRKWLKILIDSYRYSRNLKRNVSKEKNRLVLAISRYKIVGESYQDLFLQEEIDKENSIVIHTAQPNGSHFFYDTDKIILEDWYFFFWRSIYHIQKRLRLRNIKSFAKLESEFNMYFNVEFNLSNIIQDQLLLFKLDSKIYNRLLKIINPSEIVLTDHYSSPIALVAIAKEKNIKVIEYQHGGIDGAHLGYNFPNQTFVPYYPDEIVLFGSFWKTQFNSPDTTIIRVKHNSYYQNRIDAIKESRTSLKFDVLAISNDFEFNRLLVEFAEANSNIEIMMKLHPGSLGMLNEQDLHYSHYPKGTNLTIVYNELDLYDCLEQCRIAVGTNSTGLFEAIACGKRTYVLNPDSQPKVFTDLIKDGYLTGIIELNELLLVHPEPISKDCSIFFG